MNDEQLTDIVRGLIRLQPEMVEYLIIDQIKNAIRGSHNSDGLVMSFASVAEVLGLEEWDIENCKVTGAVLRNKDNQTKAELQLRRDIMTHFSNCK